MIGPFSVGTIDLSSYDDVTGLKNTANVYYVEGIARPLSLAQLVMAVCLERAATKESKVVELMNTLANTTKAIEQLSWLENILVGFSDTGIPKLAKDKRPGLPYDLHACEWYSILASDQEPPEGCYGYANQAPPGQGDKGRWTNWLESLGVKPFPVGTMSETYSAADVSKILDAIETRLDSLNTTSQKDMIMLQSETTKRDQTYDLITVMVKSIGGASTSISSSMR